MLHHDDAMRYRRAKVAGGTYFFTVNLADRSRQLLTERIDLLRGAVRQVKSRHPFEGVAWVVLPEHLHAIWILPPGDVDFSTRWLLIKATFSRGIAREEHVRTSRLRKGERGIWQHRFWEHFVRDEDDLRRHVDYVHFNPVKHGHVARASDWPHSSTHRYVRQGILTTDWACAADEGKPMDER
jgi:putative transposase